MQTDGYARPHALASTAWVGAHGGAPTVRFVVSLASDRIHRQSLERIDPMPAGLSIRSENVA